MASGMSGILGAVGGVLGSIFPVVGTTIGGLAGTAIGGLMDQSDAKEAASASAASVAATNQQNYEMSERQMAFQSDQAQRAMDFSATQVSDQREWLTSMSNSAYQRATQDMMGAGLNPMLAYSQGGASTPSSSAPQGVTGGAGARAEMIPPQIAAVNTGVAKARLSMDIATAIAGIQKTVAETKEAESRIDVNRATIPKFGSEQELNDAKKKDILDRLREMLPLESYKMRGEGSRVWEDAKRILEQKFLTKEMAAHELEKIGLTKAEVQRVMVETELMRYDIPRARNVANVQDSPWMENVSPYLSDVLRSISGAGQLYGNFRPRR